MAEPEIAKLLIEAQQALERSMLEPRLAVRACEALLAACERIPPDEPADREAPARIVAEAAERCLRALAAAEQPLYGAPLAACRANALRLLRDDEGALALFEKLLREHPERGGSWFDLGLLHKLRGSFREGLEANRKARALLGDKKPVLWNLAICATAVGEGAAAVEALRALGHDAKLAVGGMPYVEAMPAFQIRVAALGSGFGPASHVPDRSVVFELLWVTALSPCHGVVSSASFREGTVDYGDLVLWDGTPVGVVEHDGRPIVRFPLLALLRKGDERRFRFVALEQGAGQVAAFASELPLGAKVFVHVERIEQLCARCASGDHMRKHEHSPPEPHRLVYGKLVAPGSIDLAELRKQLEDRLRLHPGVQVVLPGLLEALGETAAAGRAHQLWRGLERNAAKPAS